MPPFLLCVNYHFISTYNICSRLHFVLDNTISRLMSMIWCKSPTKREQRPVTPNISVPLCHTCYACGLSLSRYSDHNNGKRTMAGSIPFPIYRQKSSSMCRYVVVIWNEDRAVGMPSQIYPPHPACRQSWQFVLFRQELIERFRILHSGEGAFHFNLL